MNGVARFLLFGNYFYGFCAVALSVESGLQQHTTLNSLVYYLMVFIATVLYYTHAYRAEPASQTANKRSVWYAVNKTTITRSQSFHTLLFTAAFIYWIRYYWPDLAQLNLMRFGLIFLFPVVAALYYGSMEPSGATHSLRNKGWLKPFVIGFVWAGAVTVYPLLFSSIENDRLYVPDYVNILLFINNFMFISMLCILFDIKDYAADHNQHLKTFVVRIGLRKTIFYILIPLSIIGLGTFILYALLHHFSFLRILINTIPFILLIIVAYSMHRRKSILYYLAIIDGLMLVKAVCGIIGILLFK